MNTLTPLSANIFFKIRCFPKHSTFQHLISFDPSLAVAFICYPPILYEIYKCIMVAKPTDIMVTFISKKKRTEERKIFLIECKKNVIKARKQMQTCT